MTFGGGHTVGRYEPLKIPYFGHQCHLAAGWHSRFDVTCELAARSLQAYIAVSCQMHRNPSSLH